MNKISMRSYLITITRVLFTGAALVLRPDSVLSANAGSLTGVVQTGGTSSSQPLPNVHVTLLETTTGQPTVLGQATTDASGHFLITSPKNTSSSIFFVSADIRGGVEFVAILGPNLPASITINELTTVAASYSMAQFYRTGVISGNSFGLQIAAGMNDNIVRSATGESSPVLLTSPNADETNSLRSTRSLANLLVACAHYRFVALRLLRLTTPPLGAAPSNTAQALANLARNPGQSVGPIYQLTRLANSYEPALVRRPDAWTVTVKVNDSGSDERDRLISGTGNIAFDQRGYAWVSNNTVQGTPNSGVFNLVFKPNGQPADGTNRTPRSPLTGGGVLGGGFGVTIDPRGSVWFGNFGWGMCEGCDPSPDGNGSVSRFTLGGIPLSPPDAYQGGPVRAQGMASDAKGNIWISSFKNDRVYVFPRGNPHHSVRFQQYDHSGPFDVAIAADGTAWVANSGGLLGDHDASVAKYRLVNGALQQQFLHSLGQVALKGLSLDSHGNAWAAALGSNISGFGNLIYAFRPDGTEIGQFNGVGGMDHPWGVAIDGEDNVWVANFGVTASGPPFTGRLTKLWGVNPPLGHNVGDPISPPTGYTVPTAGSEVLLHDGVPLYGYGSPPGPPCLIPMMRQTAVAIDQAGNIWSMNNWKPDYDIDTIGGNPGGDGIIIFVGLAAPPATQVQRPQLANVSARAFVQTGDDVMIGGFMVQGTESKRVIIRAIGPELTQYGVPNPLFNPTLELHDGTGALIASNNNWATTIIGGIITSNQVGEIRDSGYAPGDPTESAIIADLPAGHYTAIVRGVNNTTGVALVEVYNLSHETDSILGNISARSFVQTGDNVMIGGFMVQGTEPKRVIIRAIGPELTKYGIPDALANPTLELLDETGALIASNNNWASTIIGGIITSNQVHEIQASGYAPGDPSESAIIADLPAGNYTAVVRGVNNMTGVALVEVYDLQ